MKASCAVAGGLMKNMQGQMRAGRYIDALYSRCIFR